jgi:urate oxidase
MAIVLGPNQYGKAETRVVRVYRDSGRHEIRDLNVSTVLRGDFAAAHTRGDQSGVLPTDSQKNTCFAYAKEHGVAEIEDYALVLARHFVTDIAPVTGARVEVEEYPWERVSVAGQPHPHTFVRASGEVRTTAVTVTGRRSALRSWVVSGLDGLVVLKSTGSEFSGFLKDRYTTLAETSDRVLATSLAARWRYEPRRHRTKSWDEAHAEIRQILLERFADVHSLALQQTLWEMGRAVLEARDDVAEIRLSAPNRHHFLADLAPFGLDNPGEVFYAADRPYGLIQAAVQRDDAGDPGPAWDSAAAFAS